MRPLLLSALAVAAIAVLVLAIPSADAEDDPTVSYNGMDFIPLSPGVTEMTLVNIDESAYTADLVIPAAFTVAGTDYTVAGIGQSSICSAVVRTIDFSNNPNLKYINEAAFECDNLEEFRNLDNPGSKYVAIDGILYEEQLSYTNVFRCPPAISLTSFEISNCNSISVSAFHGCTAIQEITFGSNVDIFEIPAYTFCGCTSLTKIGYNPSDGYNHLPESVIVIKFSAFSDCTSLGNMYMPATLRIIEDFAFHNCGFERFHLDSEISYIEDWAFAACTKFTTFEYFNDEFFDVPGYVVLDGVLYSDGRTKSLVCYPAGKAGDTYTLQDSVSEIARGAFYGTKYLKNFVANSLMTSVNAFAFEACTSLESVDLKGRVTLLDVGAFYGCRNLTTLKGFSGVASIGSDAFGGSGITSYEFSSSIRHVSGWAFSDTKLTSITFPDCPVTLEASAFSGCLSLKDITFEGDDFTLDPGSLNIGREETPAEVTVHIIKTASIPSDACDDGFTTVHIDKEGEHPYPYENLIGVFVCLLILLGIFRIIKEV